MIRLRRDVLLPLLAVAAVLGLLFYVSHGIAVSAAIDRERALVASLDGPAVDDAPAPDEAAEGPADALDDAFSASRRAGFLWLGVMVGIAAGLRELQARMRPREGEPPRPGSFRARILLVASGGFVVVVALVEMYAASRGLAPVATAALGAVVLYYGAKDDPAPGSRRKAPTEDVPT